MLDDPEAVEKLAVDSIYHANGFAKIPFPEGIRLHVWPAGSGGCGGQSDVHGHCWPFASWIITGRLEETTYVEDDGGEVFDIFEYDPNEKKVPATPTGVARLAARPPVDRDAGTVYVRSADDLHVAEPGCADLVASLLVKGKTVRESTPVYRRPGAEQPRGRPLPPADLRSFLEIVISVLQSVR